MFDKFGNIRLNQDPSTFEERKNAIIWDITGKQHKPLTIRGTKKWIQTGNDIKLIGYIISDHLDSSIYLYKNNDVFTLEAFQYDSSNPICALTRKDCLQVGVDVLDIKYKP